MKNKDISLSRAFEYGKQVTSINISKLINPPIRKTLQEENQNFINLLKVNAKERPSYYQGLAKDLGPALRNLEKFDTVIPKINNQWSLTRNYERSAQRILKDSIPLDNQSLLKSVGINSKALNNIYPLEQLRKYIHSNEYVPFSNRTNLVHIINSNLFKVNPVLARFILARNNWLIDENLDRELTDSSKRYTYNELEDKVVNYYVKNHHQNIYKLLDELISNTGDAVQYGKSYRSYFQDWKIFLEQNFKVYKVLIPVLGGMIENAVARHVNLLNSSKGAVIKNSVLEVKNELKEKQYNTANLHISLIVDVICDMWNGKKQNFSDGKDKVKIGRHSLNHGRVDPSRYTEIEFIKLLLIFRQLVKFPWPTDGEEVAD